MKKKITVSSELMYVMAVVTLTLAVAMTATTDFGVSMIVAPAYVISLRLDFLTFGQSEYVVQGLLFILLCIAMRKVRLVYFCSFATGVFYGAVLDLWRLVIPHFNPDITPPGSLPFSLRCVYFVLGIILTAFSVAVLFRTYLYPQVYDTFVRLVSEKYNVPLTKFKTCFDMTCLLIASALTLVVFGSFHGVGVGTIIMTFVNGPLIGLIGKAFDKFFAPDPSFPKLAAHFE